MSAEQLITKHLDIWTSAHKTRSSAGRGSSNKLELYGIKKLRELILELAVRGKLVPQNAIEINSVSVLEKIENDDFQIPNNWIWMYLGKIVEILDSKRKPVSKTQRADGPYPYYGASGIVDFIDDFIFDEPLVLVGEDGAKWGKGESTAFLVSGKTWVNNHAHVLRPIRSYISDEYLTYFLTAIDLGEYITGITVPKLNQARLISIPIAVPPIDEQKRIVEKVDELMAFCDELEQAQTDNIAAHAQLVEALLTTLTNSKDHQELQANWQRIAEHFDTLFTTEDSIDQLKQTILQLAVMGKVVPQDPNDEPASELLKKIAAEKAQLIKEGKIKKEKPLPEVTDDEKPFELPRGWEIVRLGDLTSKLGSGSTPRGGQSAYVNEGIIFLRSQNIWNHGLNLDDIAYISDETHSKMDGTKVCPDDILLNITGASLGRSTIFPTELSTANVSQHVTIIRLIETEMVKFVHLGIMSPMIQQLVWKRQVGMAIEGLSKKVLEVFEFPVPPLAEQKRIVLKVDELMTLCDVLKQNIRHSESSLITLTDVFVDSISGVQHSSKSLEGNEDLSMEIKTLIELNLNVQLPREAVLANIIRLEGGVIDAKVLWKKSQMDLPNFYKQLKYEITAEYIVQPKAAEIQ